MFNNSLPPTTKESDSIPTDTTTDISRLQAPFHGGRLPKAELLRLAEKLNLIELRFECSQTITKRLKYRLGRLEEEKTPGDCMLNRNDLGNTQYRYQTAHMIIEQRNKSTTKSQDYFNVQSKWMRSVGCTGSAPSDTALRSFQASTEFFTHCYSFLLVLSAPRVVCQHSTQGPLAIISSYVPHSPTVRLLNQHLAPNETPNETAQYYRPLGEHGETMTIMSFKTPISVMGASIDSGALLVAGLILSRFGLRAAKKLTKELIIRGALDASLDRM